MRFAKSARSEAGSALLEFSLIVPIVSLMFMAVADFGLAISEEMTVTGAAVAGTQYGAVGGNSSDTAGMITAANNAAVGITGWNQPVATTWCSCSPGGSQVTCSSTCTGYGDPVQYVQVQTSATVQILMGYPGIPTSFALTGLSILRVQ